MAKLDYSKSSGAKLLESVSKKSAKEANGNLIINIPIDLIDVNEDNSKIFNMDKIELLARSINEDGFSGGVELLKKDDGRYELSAGHRRLAAVKLLGWTEIPSIVSQNIDDVLKAKKLIRSNINNRELTPLDWANLTTYYMENVLRPEKERGDFTGGIEKKCMEDLGISISQMQRYRAIKKMIPELQELSAEHDFPFSAITPAATMTDEQQKLLYTRLQGFMKIEEDGLISLTITRPEIQAMIRAIKGLQDDATKAQDINNNFNSLDNKAAPESAVKNQNTSEPAILLDDIDQAEGEQLFSENSLSSYYNKDDYSKEDQGLADQKNPDMEYKNEQQKVNFVDNVIMLYANKLREIAQGQVEIQDKKTVMSYLFQIEEYIKDLKSQI